MKQSELLGRLVASSHYLERWMWERVLQRVNTYMADKKVSSVFFAVRLKDENLGIRGYIDSSEVSYDVIYLSLPPDANPKESFKVSRVK